jgi:hypothetical protein
MTPPPLPPVMAAPPRADVRYTLTRWDILRWQVYLLIRNRVLIGLMLVASVSLALADVRRPEMSGDTTGYKAAYVVVFIILMCGFAGVVTLATTVAMVMFKKFRGFLGDHELEIREEGLVERTEFNETMHRWSGFHKLVRTGGYLYIWVTDNSMHIVPLRYFASEQEERAFREEIARRIPKR